MLLVENFLASFMDIIMRIRLTMRKASQSYLLDAISVSISKIKSRKAQLPIRGH